MIPTDGLGRSWDKRHYDEIAELVESKALSKSQCQTCEPDQLEDPDWYAPHCVNGRIVEPVGTVDGAIASIEVGPCPCSCHCSCSCHNPSHKEQQ